MSNPMRGLLSSLILHDKVVTTEAKAKELKQRVEKLISRSKKLDLVSRRRILSLLPEEPAAKKLFERIVPQFKDRVGGYVRIIKLPSRKGDHSPMARVEFVEKIAEATPKELKKQLKSARKPARVMRKVPRRSAPKKNASNKISKSKRS